MGAYVMENRFYVGKYNDIIRKCNEIIGKNTHQEAGKNDKVTLSHITVAESLLKDLQENHNRK